MISESTVLLNGVDYRWPAAPIVVVCIDGGDPAYIERGLRDGDLPNIARFVRDRFDLLFLSLTDYIQHKHAPGDPIASAFHRRLDDCFGRLASLGATVALTADHGIIDKALPDGSPNIVYLQDILDEAFGVGDTRVICPITGAFVRHHGSLSGFVRVPFILSRPLNPIYQRRASRGPLRSREIFEYAINGTVPE